MHRYGRHGPRAWLRWRKRHYRPSVPVVRPRFIPVPLPRNAERIIIIVGTSPDSFNEQEPVVEMYVREMPRITEEMASIPAPQTDIERLFEEMAKDDVEDFAGKILTYAWLQEHVRSILRKNLAGRFYQFSERERPTVYQKAIDAYVRVLRQRNVRCSISPMHDAILRQAFKDKEDAPPKRDFDNRVAFHQRDLGVVRILQICGIEIADAPSRLADIHDLVDDYDRFYGSNPEEVIWLKSQENF